MKRKRIMVIGILLFLLVACLRLVCPQDIVTELNVSNVPPALLQYIPNQSWPAGQNLTNAFDLDDYFYDANGDFLEYSHSIIENITIVLISGAVSFFPDSGFIGTRNITFYASDSSTNTSSNLVFLFVGTDEEPPQWSSPSKNRATIYQSMHVNFTTLWTDNLALKSFYFSINQGGGWVSYPAVNFSGQSNISTYQAQISGAPGTTAYWKFCAYDTSLNINCTAVQNFSISQRAIPPSPPPPSTAPPPSGFDAISRIFREEVAENFTVEPSSFKISLKQGATETRIMRIANPGISNLSFNISVVDLESMVYLGEETFVVLPGESRDITIDFFASLSTPPSQYFGFIKLESSEVRHIPIVLDVNALEFKFSVNVEIPQDYKTVMPGEIVRANISILNLKDIFEKNMSLYIAIKDFYGNIYDSNEENFVFNSSMFFERKLSVPKEAYGGQYIFYARALAGEGLALDSDTFEVGSRYRFLASLKSSFIFILIFILCLVALILMVVYSRSKEKERILSLYLMLNELKNLIKEEKFDQAIELYVRIKRVYGEPVSRVALEDREKLKEEIRALSLKLKERVNMLEEKRKNDNQEKKPEEEKIKKQIKAPISETRKPKEEKRGEEKEGGTKHLVGKNNLKVMGNGVKNIKKRSSNNDVDHLGEERMESVGKEKKKNKRGTENEKKKTIS